MITLQDAVTQTLREPTPIALVALQGALLASEHQGEARDHALEIAGQFYAYLSELESKISAKAYSELASRLDIGAVGVVALENIITGEGERFWQGFLMGGLAEILMVAASRQYVKGWEVETGLVHTLTAWTLTEALWRTSAELQPEISPERRWQAIGELLAPAYDAEIPAQDKAVLLGRVFQILLLKQVAPLLPSSEDVPR